MSSKKYYHIPPQVSEAVYLTQRTPTRFGLSRIQPQSVTMHSDKSKKTYDFQINLQSSQSTKVNFRELIRKEAEGEAQKLQQTPVTSSSLSSSYPRTVPVVKSIGKPSLNPYASDDDDQLKALAASFESKYGDKPKTKKIGKVGGKKRKHDFDLLGEGYDESDPFIDNTECFDEVVPQEITTAHGGFYINTGALEFKENKNAIFNLSSDDEKPPEEKEKKVKKAKKDPTKKQVQTKEIKEKEKPKVKVTEVKRKARIITTNPNIKGPGAKGNGNVVTSELAKAEPKKIEMKRVEAPKQEKVVAAAAPKSPDKTVPKPPDILNLGTQLGALNQSKSVEVSKTESKPVNPPKAAPKAAPKVTMKKGRPVSISGPLPSSSLADLKLPASVRVTKVEDPKTATKPPLNNAYSNKMGWFNQVDFAAKNKENPKAAPTPSPGPGPGTPALTAKKVLPPPKPAVSKAQTSSAALQAGRAVGPGVSPNSLFLNQKNSRPAPGGSSSLSPSQNLSPHQTLSLPTSSVSSLLSPARSPASSTVASSPPVDSSKMFQHDPKNILASAVTTMSSVLGTTAPYFAQKLQQKPAVDLTMKSPLLQTPKHDSSVTSSSLSSSYPRTVPVVKSILESPVVSQVPSPSQPKTVGSPSRSSVERSSSGGQEEEQQQQQQMTKLPTAPNTVASIDPQETQPLFDHPEPDIGSSFGTEADTIMLASSDNDERNGTESTEKFYERIRDSIFESGVSFSSEDSKDPWSPPFSDDERDSDLLAVSSVDQPKLDGTTTASVSMVEASQPAEMMRAETVGRNKTEAEGNPGRERTPMDFTNLLENGDNDEEDGENVEQVEDRDEAEQVEQVVMAGDGEETEQVEQAEEAANLSLPAASSSKAQPRRREVVQTERYSCPHCTKTFWKMVEFQPHLRRHFSDEVDSALKTILEESNWRCPVCPAKEDLHWPDYIMNNKTKNLKVFLHFSRTHYIAQDLTFGPQHYEENVTKIIEKIRRMSTGPISAQPEIVSIEDRDSEADSTPLKARSNKKGKAKKESKKKTPQRKKKPARNAESDDEENEEEYEVEKILKKRVVANSVEYQV